MFQRFLRFLRFLKCLRWLVGIPLDRGFETGEQVTDLAGKGANLRIIDICKVAQIMGKFQMIFSLSQ